MSAERLAYNLKEAIQSTGMNRTSLYRAMAMGHLESFKIGRRRMISARALRAFIENKEQDSANTNPATRTDK